MHVHYVTLPEIYFNPVKLKIHGQEYEVLSPTVSDYLRFASLHNQFQSGKITEEEMAQQAISIFLPFIKDQLHPAIVQNLFALCMSTFNTDEQRVFNFNEKEFNFGKKEETEEVNHPEGSLEYIKAQVNKVKSSYLFIDLIKQVVSVVRFYGLSHKEVMDMPYVWFLNYLTYKSKIEAEEDMRSLYTSAASQSTDCKKAFDKLKSAARLDCDTMNEMTNGR